LAWNKIASEAGTRARVFCASMADVFEQRDDLDPLRERLWSVIGQTPHLDWLLLTKRPEHVDAMVPWHCSWPDNVWLSTTAEKQAWAERRVPELIKHPARVRFVSCEPVLGPIDLSSWLRHTAGRWAVDWVIAGGESGHHARPSNPEWFRLLRDQCIAHRVAFHFKQWGNWCPTEARLLNGHQSRKLRAYNGEPIYLVNLGKKAAGRRLDGQEWNQAPTV
jgi:protein gp37